MITRTRWYGALVSVIVLAAVASPLLRDPRERRSDSFPLSTYPMFATPRSTHLSLSYAVGIAGSDRPALGPDLIGSPEVLQAMALIRRAVDAGPAARADLCRSIALRVAADDDLAAVTDVALIRGDHDAVDLLVHHRRGREIEAARCPVPRGAR